MGERLQVYDSNFEQCMKCSICTAYCPVTLVNQKFPGPKQSGPDGERYRLKDIEYFDTTLDYCLNCKRCEVACPSNVKIADIIQVVRFKHASAKPILRNRLLAQTDMMGKMAGIAAPLFNKLLRAKLTRSLLDRTLKIDSKRLYPSYSTVTFRKWFNGRKRLVQIKYKRKVAFFHGCYTNYNYPKLGKDLVKILNAVGIGVELIKEKCCGMPLIMNGLVEKAHKNARINIESISDAVKRGLPVLTTSTTCTLTLRDEYDHILGLDNHEIRDSILMATRYIYDLVVNRKIILKFKEGAGKKVAYHTSCHMEKLGWAIYSSKLISLIPDSKIIVMETNCCGLSGTYGFKKENYGASQKIGQTLFKRIARINPDLVVTDCESCKWQIEMSTPYKVENPISLIADALDVEETMRANGIR